MDKDTSHDDGAGNGRFKAPSLRNVAVRGPFMHDGRFATLREVVEHYDSGVGPHPGLDPALMDGTLPRTAGFQPPDPTTSRQPNPYESRRAGRPLEDFGIRGSGIRGSGDEPQRLELTDAEIDALVAFLETLTDEAFLRDPRFSDPFTD